MTGVGGGVFDYDTRIFGYDWEPYESPVADYLNHNAKKEELYSAIHVDSSPKRRKYASSSTEVYIAYTPEESEDYTEKISNVIDAGVPFLIYAGEFDIVCGP
mmetsp:Transcript_26515/g.19871  ORF Transcript_26515/g.19871 Transcript_26515/m.19871 type:complete len:102 (+) Transcript_26515:568-873(+)|eukprot:CAMPEP_0202957574 /NCGR_PEP_ID=MMETSP1396-20130829/1932_1 /ASSEMBLY_ACC=CAM_ASM_000872 /TAXON_ID= /ORGANISM="Pseudokeronopsis sp., Strain Brazil" /LENGTH=101 /DNA_ID=CAMNT_0049675115 /DNA_START=945 /DNA_END=1250 /DNA_ORIENTATION=+